MVDIENAEFRENEDFQDLGTLKEDALEYIAGYIIQKLNLDEYLCRENFSTRVDQISKKNLTDFLIKIKQIELIFENINGSSGKTSQPNDKNEYLGRTSKQC